MSNHCKPRFRVLTSIIVGALAVSACSSGFDRADAVDQRGVGLLPRFCVPAFRHCARLLGQVQRRHRMLAHRFLIRFVLTILPALILIAIPAYAIFVGGRALFRRLRKSKAVEEVKEEKK